METADWTVLGLIVWASIVGLIMLFFAGAREASDKDDEC